LDHVAALSSGGKLLVFALDEMRTMPRGRGVIVMGLDRDEKLQAVGLATARRVVVRGTNRVGRETTVAVEGDELAKHALHRARKGCKLGARLKPVGFARPA
jgi:topoisomerase-4 subunit A